MAKLVDKPRLMIQTLEGVEILELSDQGTWTFGRSTQNTVPLSDPFASRYHAKLEINRDGYCYFADLDSRNGTLLNDQPLTTPVWLKHGDRITIGETIIIFEHCQALTGDPSPKNSSPEQSSLAVFMVQGSVSQGEIWQEIFNILNISMVWKDSGTTLQQTFEARAAANILPKLTLLEKVDR